MECFTTAKIKAKIILQKTTTDVTQVMAKSRVATFDLSTRWCLYYVNTPIFLAESMFRAVKPSQKKWNRTAWYRIEHSSYRNWLYNARINCIYVTMHMRYMSYVATRHINVIIEYVAKASSMYIYTNNSNFRLVWCSVVQCLFKYTHSLSSSQFKLSKREDSKTYLV